MRSCRSATRRCSRPVPEIRPSAFACHRCAMAPTRHLPLPRDRARRSLCRRAGVRPRFRAEPRQHRPCRHHARTALRRHLSQRRIGRERRLRQHGLRRHELGLSSSRRRSTTGHSTTSRTWRCATSTAASTRSCCHSPKGAMTERRPSGAAPALGRAPAGPRSRGLRHAAAGLTSHAGQFCTPRPGRPFCSPLHSAGSIRRSGSACHE